MKRALALAATLLAAACTTPQSTQYFVLPDSYFSAPAHNGKEIAVKVVLAEPLQHGGLVYQTDEHHLNFAKNHLWAAPLEQAAAARFANELNRNSTRYRFVPAARSHAAQTLTVYLEAFHGSYQGKTLVQGYGRWPDGRNRNFRIETAQQGDGYTAMLES
ncbi:MAG: ABC-type transport auxiliary lipoprotein family protein, partial [Neisseria sp.]|nr:ABC-type transport auxiliary lipoprotein family protein [Neisseria sp.]